MGVRKSALAIVLCCLVLVSFGAAATAADKPIQLNWVSFLPQTSPEIKAVQTAYIDKLNGLSNGRIETKFRGGPETFGAFDIPKAVQKGVVDIGIVFIGAVEPIVPGAGAAMLTQVSLEEERRPGGAFDYLQTMFNKGGLQYLGRGFHTGSGFFYTWLRDKRVEKREDFKKISIGGTTAAQPAALAWGSTYTPVGLTDSYSAMERGVVDAITAQPPASWKDFGNYEVSKYYIDHPVYAATVAVFMNRKKFQEMPPDLQELVMKSFADAEKEIMKTAQSIEDGALKFMVDGGYLEPIKLSPEDAKWYVDSAYEGAWEYQNKRFPDVTPKLKELLMAK